MPVLTLKLPKIKFRDGTEAGKAFGASEGVPTVPAKATASPGTFKANVIPYEDCIVMALSLIKEYVKGSGQTAYDAVTFEVDNADEFKGTGLADVVETGESVEAIDFSPLWFMDALIEHVGYDEAHKRLSAELRDEALKIASGDGASGSLPTEKKKKAAAEDLLHLMRAVELKRRYEQSISVRNPSSPGAGAAVDLLEPEELSEKDRSLRLKTYIERQQQWLLARDALRAAQEAPEESQDEATIERAQAAEKAAKGRLDESVVQLGEKGFSEVYHVPDRLPGTGDFSSRGYHDWVRRGAFDVDSPTQGEEFKFKPWTGDELRGHFLKDGLKPEEVKRCLTLLWVNACIEEGERLFMELSFKRGILTNGSLSLSDDIALSDEEKKTLYVYILYWQQFVEKRYDDSSDINDYKKRVRFFIEHFDLVSEDKKDYAKAAVSCLKSGVPVVNMRTLSSGAQRNFCSAMQSEPCLSSIASLEASKDASDQGAWFDTHVVKPINDTGAEVAVRLNQWHSSPAPHEAVYPEDRFSFQPVVHEGAGDQRAGDEKSGEDDLNDDRKAEIDRHLTQLLQHNARNVDVSESAEEKELKDRLWEELRDAALLVEFQLRFRDKIPSYLVNSAVSSAGVPIELTLGVRNDSGEVSNFIPLGLFNSIKALDKREKDYFLMRLDEERDVYNTPVLYCGFEGGQSNFLSAYLGQGLLSPAISSHAPTKVPTMEPREDETSCAISPEHRERLQGLLAEFPVVFAMHGEAGCRAHIEKIQRFLRDECLSEKDAAFIAHKMMAVNPGLIDFSRIFFDFLNPEDPVPQGAEEADEKENLDAIVSDKAATPAGFAFFNFGVSDDALTGHDIGLMFKQFIAGTHMSFSQDSPWTGPLTLEERDRNFLKVLDELDPEVSDGLRDSERYKHMTTDACEASIAQFFKPLLSQGYSPYTVLLKCVDKVAELERLPNEKKRQTYCWLAEGLNLALNQLGLPEIAVEFLWLVLLKSELERLYTVDSLRDFKGTLLHSGKGRDALKLWHAINNFLEHKVDRGSQQERSAELLWAWCAELIASKHRTYVFSSRPGALLELVRLQGGAPRVKVKGHVDEQLSWLAGEAGTLCRQHSGQVRHSKCAWLTSTTFYAGLLAAIILGVVAVATHGLSLLVPNLIQSVSTWVGGALFGGFVAARAKRRYAYDFTNPTFRSRKGALFVAAGALLGAVAVTLVAVAVTALSHGTLTIPAIKTVIHSWKIALEVAAVALPSFFVAGQAAARLRQRNYQINQKHLHFDQYFITKPGSAHKGKFSISGASSESAFPAQPRRAYFLELSSKADHATRHAEGMMTTCLPSQRTGARDERESLHKKLYKNLNALINDTFTAKLIKKIVAKKYGVFGMDDLDLQRRASDALEQTFNSMSRVMPSLPEVLGILVLLRDDDSFAGLMSDVSESEKQLIDSLCQEFQAVQKDQNSLYGIDHLHQPYENGAGDAWETDLQKSDNVFGECLLVDGKSAFLDCATYPLFVTGALSHEIFNEHQPFVSAPAPTY